MSRRTGGNVTVWWRQVITHPVLLGVARAVGLAIGALVIVALARPFFSEADEVLQVELLGWLLSVVGLILVVRACWLIVLAVVGRVSVAAVLWRVCALVLVWGVAPNLARGYEVLTRSVLPPSTVLVVQVALTVWVLSARTSCTVPVAASTEPPPTLRRLSTVVAATEALDRNEPVIALEIATHEAGHILAAATLGYMPRSVRLYPGESSNAEVNTAIHDDPCGEWDSLVISVAGLVAEEIVGVHSSRGSGHDFVGAVTEAAQIVARGWVPAGYSGLLTIDGVMGHATTYARVQLSEHAVLLEQLASRLRCVGEVLLSGEGLWLCR